MFGVVQMKTVAPGNKTWAVRLNMDIRLPSDAQMAAATLTAALRSYFSRLCCMKGFKILVTVFEMFLLLCFVKFMKPLIMDTDFFTTAEATGCVLC